MIIDDEPPARARLQRLLAAETDLTIVGEVDNGAEAIERALDLRPDLILLDIEMPEVDGLSVLRELQTVWSPAVIFTTAHPQPAVDAFALNAVDYLLKPFPRARLAAAVQRARVWLRAQVSADVAAGAEITPGPTASASRSPYPDRFLVRSGNSYRVVPLRDVVSVQAAANYIVLRTRTGKHILRRTLRQFEAELDPNLFQRTSRSTLVNLREVTEIKAGAASTHTLILSDGSELPLTLGLREFEQRLLAAV